MAGRYSIVVLAFAAGAAIVALMPGLSTTLQRVVGIGAQTKIAANSPKPNAPEVSPSMVPMGDEQIKGAQI